MQNDDVIYEAGKGVPQPWIENRKESDPQKRQELNNELSARRGFYIEYPPDKKTGSKRKVSGTTKGNMSPQMNGNPKGSSRKRVAGKK